MISTIEVKKNSNVYILYNYYNALSQYNHPQDIHFNVQ